MATSPIIQVKSLILANLDVDKRIKAAVLDLFNALDNDLVVGGYEASSDVEDTIRKLDNALIEIESEQEELKTNLSTSIVEEEDEEVHGFREVSLDEKEDDS
jgi:hypothetical protein